MRHGVYGVVLVLGVSQRVHHIRHQGIRVARLDNGYITSETGTHSSLVVHVWIGIGYPSISDVFMCAGGQKAVYNMNKKLMVDSITLTV